MAQLTITIPDAAVPRIRAAYGHRNPNNAAQWIDATVVEVQDALKAVLRSKVIDYETTLAAEADRAARSNEAAAW